MAWTFDADQFLGIDDHLPAVPTAQLNIEALRQRFATPPRWSPEFEVERPRTTRAPAAASVLIGLVERLGQLTVLFTQRTDHLTDHPGQISFPGGRAEPEDQGDPVATALREATEEIGLSPDHVDVIGRLPTYTTGSGFVVTPVVAMVTEGFSVAADPSEVAEVFEVPLVFLMNPANHRRHEVEMGGHAREFVSMPWTGVDSEGRERRYVVWGATAAMVRNLYRLLAA
jgi:8-oxo-dGTP pyrophosphatase MutT (NUDIX family)